MEKSNIIELLQLLFVLISDNHINCPPAQTGLLQVGSMERQKHEVIT
uniref:Uncharacterized protein n=1 Tax=Arundo donax TaxID=35708 RepID=A0A0A9BXM4_ARUDO